MKMGTVPYAMLPLVFYLADKAVNERFTVIRDVSASHHAHERANGRLFHGMSNLPFTL